MRYTAAQVGNARPAVDPHTGRLAPAVTGDLDLSGREYEGIPENVLPEAGMRTVRARMTGRAQLASRDVVTQDDTPDERARVHEQLGSPDPRRQDYLQGRGYSAGEIGFEAQPVIYDNTRRIELVEPEAPPSRPRLGWTGDDPARTPFYRRPSVMRKFDKNMAEHPRAIDKVPQPAPLARTPYRLSDLGAGTRPYPGGATGSQRAGQGSPQPNTFRIMPSAWDRLLVNVGGPAASPSDPDPAQRAASQQRSRSFRL